MYGAGEYIMGEEEADEAAPIQALNRAGSAILQGLRDPGESATVAAAAAAGMVATGASGARGVLQRALTLRKFTGGSTTRVVPGAAHGRTRYAAGAQAAACAAPGAPSAQQAHHMRTSPPE